MLKIKVFFSLLAALLFFNSAFAQVTFYDLTTIQRIDIYFSQTNWDYQMDTAKHGSEGYILADSICINSVRFDSAGVKYKGNSSYDSTYAKNPLHISLNEVKTQSYQGITDIKLSNGYADPSVIREVLAYEILGNYMDCPRSNFAQVFINGSYTGWYANNESIGKSFCSNHFYSSSNTFLKCNPIVNPGPTTKSNLRYIPLADSSGYFNFYEVKSNSGWNELVTLCDTVTNYSNSIDYNMDMDRVMWMLAFNTVLVNLDSYTGVFCQNYYLYKDNTNRFNPVVWDLNMAFGGFPFVGSGNSSMGSLTLTNMQQLSPTFHAIDGYWPLINAVAGNTSFKKQFIAHARTINNENFVNNSYLNTATQLQTLVDSAVQADSNNFFTYAQFQNALTTNYPFGSYSVPGIINLMTGRVNYLQTNADFMYVPPVITSVFVSNTTPAINSAVTVTANVSNSNAVFLGYRSLQSNRFVRVPMYDDGLHNDGSAGDNIFGASLQISSLITQYYVFAENINAGIFSPERAEHEFYSINAQAATPTVGQVVINEFLASNINDATNESGIHADWIELHNNTATPLPLFGLYLTDDFTNPTKYAFPQNAIINANDYLILWADEDASTPAYLHCNFKLSANGEALMLSNGNNLILDSITYGAQTTDVSMGRCPDGAGTLGLLNNTSFNAENCTTSTVYENSKSINTIKIFPNPTTDFFNFSNSSNYNLKQITISNCTGQTVKSIVPSGVNQIDVSNLNCGIYFVTLTDAFDHQIQVKLVKI